jgi:hypothetical protein
LRGEVDVWGWEDFFAADEGGLDFGMKDGGRADLVEIAVHEDKVGVVAGGELALVGLG